MSAMREDPASKVLQRAEKMLQEPKHARRRRNSLSLDSEAGYERPMARKSVTEDYKFSTQVGRVNPGGHNLHRRNSSLESQSLLMRSIPQSLPLASGQASSNSSLPPISDRSTRRSSLSSDSGFPNSPLSKVSVNSSLSGLTPARMVAQSRNNSTGSLADSPATVEGLMSMYNAEVLAKGSQGTIYKGSCPQSKEEVVIKLSELKNDTIKVNSQREVSVYKELSKHTPHPHLLSALQHHTKKKHVVIVAPKYPTDLYTILRNNVPINSRTACRLTVQLMNATRHLHRCGFAHRDIKPENILLSDRDPSIGNVVLCDFGLCGVIRKSPMLMSACGTRRYGAPEVFADDKGDTGYDGTCVDVWSIGIVFFILLTGFTPWAEANISDVNYKVWTTNKVAFWKFVQKHSRNEISAPIQEVLECMCNPEPGKRCVLEGAMKMVSTINESLGMFQPSP